MAQADILYDLLSDGEPHRTDEIMRKVYGGSHLGLSRVGARIFDVKAKYNVKIDGWKDEHNPTLYWYQIHPASEITVTNKNVIEAFDKVEKKLKQEPLFKLNVHN